MTDVLTLGEVVRLKSGGPNMTITNMNVLGIVGAVDCTWFVNDKQEHGPFAMEALVAVPMQDAGTSWAEKVP